MPILNTPFQFDWCDPGLFFFYFGVSPHPVVHPSSQYMNMTLDEEGANVRLPQPEVNRITGAMCKTR